MSNLSCEQMKLRLEETLDQGREPDQALAAHLKACGDCRAYRKFLYSYGPQLKAELDVQTGAAAAPAGQRISLEAKTRVRKRRLVSIMAAAAAAVVIAAGSLSANAIVEKAESDRLVREENSYFVDELFSQPVFENVEYLTVNE